ncbi:MAG: ABC transporter substrate-binding protein [Sulfurovum sp.]
MKIKHIFIFFIVLAISLPLIDVFLLKTTDMAKLKETIKYNLINLDKDEPIRVGVVWPFSEEPTEDDFKNGILFALERLNREKVLGREIEVIFENDKGDKKLAKAIATKFANEKDILAVIAHNNVDIAIPASITYEYAGMIMISPAVSSPSFTRENFDYIFRNTPSDSVIGEKLADFAKQMNFKKIIVLSSRDSYSEGLREVFIEKAIHNKIEIVYTQKFNPKEREFTKIVTDISPKINHKIDYDAIFVAGDEDSVPILIKKARNYGIFAPFLTGDRLDSTSILDLGKEMDGTIVATIFNTDVVLERTQNFIEDFRKVYNHTPDTWAAQGYDAMMLLATAIRKAKSLNPDLISRELKYTNNYNSIFGDYSLDTKGDVVGRKIYFKVVKSGKFKYITKDSY